MDETADRVRAEEKMGDALLVKASGDARDVQTFAPNAWVRVNRDGTVTVLIDRAEMGQGIVTGLAMLVAEELEIDLDRVRTEFAPADEAYTNPKLGEQMTGGSTSTRAAWKPLREAGAAAREMLIEAAAKTWGARKSKCRAESGEVIHVPSGRRMGYAELVAKASELRVPRKVSLKPHDDFRLLGKPTPRLELLNMVSGRTLYGSDIVVPGRLVATVARCPVIGGRVKRFDDRQARAVEGVRHVLEIDSGVAVVAEDTWSALQGREALEVQWAQGPNVTLSSAEIRQRFERAVQRNGTVAVDQGDVSSAFRRAAKMVAAVYETPYLAHAPMEPMNCTAHVHADGCDVWVGTQAQTGAQKTAARITGLPRDRVRVHSMFIGGSFGRRLEQDFVEEAVQISKRIAAPVQVVWTRQDDMQHGCYRPAHYTILQGALDASGAPIAWFQRIVGPAITHEDVNVPYEIVHRREEYIEDDPGVPWGYWRSVGASQNAFVVEGFVDELAHAARQDPFEFRRLWLTHEPRCRAVLELAAEKAGWGNPSKKDRHQGIALYHCFESYVAEVAEVSVSAMGEIKVQRVVCAVDCGTTINPDGVRSQIEGAVAFGLSAALKGEITIENGCVQQATFADYPLITMADMPEVEVHILTNRQSPGGVGEPGVPPIAPAVANAVFAATGKRRRRLPLRLPN
ncbi:MAG: molybdopterin cofactor-binding domain-containing protein [Acidiferrobacterales bacterium]